MRRVCKEGEGEQVGWVVMVSGSGLIVCCGRVFGCDFPLYYWSREDRNNAVVFV